MIKWSRYVVKAWLQELSYSVGFDITREFIITGASTTAFSSSHRGRTVKLNVTFTEEDDVTIWLPSVDWVILYFGRT